MPPPFLKYLDVARLVGAGIICPVCKSTRCQQSRWQSKHEKMGSEGYWPYRCDDCTNRFLAPKNASMERALINGAAGVLLCLGLLIAGDLWLESLNDPKAKRAALAATVQAKESASGGPQTQRRKENGEVDAGKDPAKLAAKLRKAAEDGDVSAMLQLGRDLAGGNNVEKDVEQAAKWMQLAAATGNAEGMFELGRIYRDGLGLEQDSVRAYAWFSRAAAAKHLTAMQERDELVRTMSDEKLKEAYKLTAPPEPVADTVRRK